MDVLILSGVRKIGSYRFLTFSYRFFLQSNSSFRSAIFLKPFFLIYLSSYNRALICFYLIIPCTSCSCSSGVLNLANTFIILYIYFYSLVLVLSRRICSLRSRSLRLITNYFLLILSLSLRL